MGTIIGNKVLQKLEETKSDVNKSFFFDIDLEGIHKLR